MTKKEDSTVAVKEVKESQKTQATKIWEEIKDLNLDMFSLPELSVEKHCKPVTVEPTKLYLTYTISSVLPALEAAIGPKYEIEQAQNYIIVSKK